ncbi:hypothetical protein HN031_05400 [Nocardioides sp. zg-1308]|uniref:Ig-like domain-containing protein n=1 Tax=Nocardioides sp. zg-1308 TaxID=2736253 RepID=UPI0015539DE7|nr:Ig-like domain-containing protein [Nocardioides sp. zg-1308]NPD04117.1 hypothetical protein [Nocardioides sp. zg-1308]
MRTHSTASPPRRHWLRSATALVLPATALALVGTAAPASAANPAEDCVISGDAFACTLTYAYTGAQQTFEVPDDVDSVTVVAVGAAGGASSNSTPGRGAVVTGEVPVTAGATYYVEVGGTGSAAGNAFNGGGNRVGDSSTHGGGGATDLRTVSRTAAGSLESRLVVAGGGGGTDVNGSNGGDAGLNGAAGTAGSGATGGPGQGGTQTAGGAGGSGATAGSLGVGGNGGSSFGAGGGGGFYGGGGGGGSSTGTGNGGGGGSSLVPAGGSVVVNTTGQAPQLRITYTSQLTAADLTIGAPSVAAGVANPVAMTVTDGVVTKSVTPTSLTISPNGTGTGASCTATACSATDIGTYTVTATFGNQTRKVTFAVVAGPAASIELSPADTTVAAGGQAAYTVTGTDQYGNDLGDLTLDSLVTTTGPSGSNVACPQGVCKPTATGDHVVTASTPGAGGVAVTDTAVLHVEADDLASIQLSPGSATVAAGGSRTYAVTGADRFGNDLGDVTADATFAFAPVGGGASTPCAAAACAPTAAGTYVVTATLGGLTDTATLVVQAQSTSVAVQPVSGVVFGEDVPVSATVTSPSGPVTGTVQFALDGTDLGAPVTLVSGAATLPAVSGLHAGLHTIRASYSSADGSFERGDDVTAFVIEKAETTTTVTATPGRIAAAVTGVGEPTGSVRFYVDGVEVGTAPLVDGAAVLEGTANDGGSVVAAAYSGDADHQASGSSTARSAPVVTTRVSGNGGSGWFSGPVTVSFVCGDDVTDCPAPVVLAKEGVGQYVSRTVIGTDGGVAVVAAGPFNLDLTAPTASLTRVGDGRTYKGRARIAQCSGSDALSGVASCTVTTTGGPFGSMTSTATVTDLAGNTATSSATYEVLDVWVARSKQDGSSWTVRKGTWSSLHVMSTKAPKLRHSGAVKASRFRMVGRRGDITHWVASVRPERSTKLQVVTSAGNRSLQLRVTR